MRLFWIAFSLSIFASWARAEPRPEGICYEVASASLQPGSGYAPGIYADVPLTGGAGSGAVATVRVGSAGSVDDVKMTDAGQRYYVGNVLTASLGSIGSGFSLTVTATKSTWFPVQAPRQHSKGQLCLAPSNTKGDGQK